MTYSVSSECKGQPGALSSRYARGLGKGRTTKVYCTQPYLAFLQEGRKENPAKHEIELTTAPSEDFGTHWGQQVFLLHPSIRVSEGDNMTINFSMNRSKENHRLLEVEFDCELRQSSGKSLPSFSKKFYIE